MKLNLPFFKEKYKDYKNSPALSFIKRIDNKSIYKLDEFKKNIMGDFAASDFSNDFYLNYDSSEVFRALYIAFTPKDKKIIDDIEITFNNNLNLSSLSEGQKKMLLIKATLEFASTEDTLILLDEPDAHIHINNKDQITKVFEPYTETRQIVITTHSPTLTQSFKDENVFMLTNGELIKKDKQFIVNELTKEFWSKQEQNHFLSQVKDTILVEGKTNIIHIETALKKLKELDEKYNELNFKYLPFNGASGLKLFVDEFPVSKITKTFAFLDRDQAGFDAIRETLDFKGTKDEFKGDIKNGIHINYIPKKEGHVKSNFVIEDYYPLEVYKEFLFKEVGCVTEMPNHSSSNFKKKFAESVEKLESFYFEGFKMLFDLILKLKEDEPKNNIIEKPEKVVSDIGAQIIKSEPVKFINTKSKRSGIKVSENEHLEGKSSNIKRMYNSLKQEILHKEPLIEIDSKVEYIAFKKYKKNIFDIKLLKSKIIMWVNKSKGELPKNIENLFIDCSNKGHHGNGDYEIHFNTRVEVEEFLMNNPIEKILEL